MDPATLEQSGALAAARRRIRGHAGDLTVTSVRDGHVEVEFHGACRGCPAVSFTHVAVVEPALLSVPGVTSVGSPQVHASAATQRRIRMALGRLGGAERQEVAIEEHVSERDRSQRSTR
jgi:Fe-S cluster biogenesis protein NfuA